MVKKCELISNKIHSLEVMMKDADKRLDKMRTNNISLSINLSNVINGNIKIEDLKGLSVVAIEYKKDLEKQETTMKSMTKMLNDIKNLLNEEN